MVWGKPSSAVSVAKVPHPSSHGIMGSLGLEKPSVQPPGLGFFTPKTTESFHVCSFLIPSSFLTSFAISNSSRRLLCFQSGLGWFCKGRRAWSDCRVGKEGDGGLWDPLGHVGSDNSGWDNRDLGKAAGTGCQRWFRDFWKFGGDKVSVASSTHPTPGSKELLNFPERKPGHILLLWGVFSECTGSCWNPQWE